MALTRFVAIKLKNDRVGKFKNLVESKRFSYYELESNKINTTFVVYSDGNFEYNPFIEKLREMKLKMLEGWTDNKFSIIEFAPYEYRNKILNL